MSDENGVVSEGLRRRMEDQTYQVQMQRLLLEEQGDLNGYSKLTAWVDVATVTVPARTHRKTVIEKALQQAGLVPPVGEQFEVRVLDADSARTATVGSVQPPPQLQIEAA